MHSVGVKNAALLIPFLWSCDLSAGLVDGRKFSWKLCRLHGRKKRQVNVCLPLRARARWPYRSTRAQTLFPARFGTMWGADESLRISAPLKRKKDAFLLPQRPHTHAVSAGDLFNAWDLPAGELSGFHLTTVVPKKTIQKNLNQGDLPSKTFN